MSYVYRLNGLGVSDTKYIVEPERASDWDIHRSREHKILTIESRLRDMLAHGTVPSIPEYLQSTYSEQWKVL